MSPSSDASEAPPAIRTGAGSLAKLGKGDGALDATSVPYEAIRRWMFEIALPFWMDAGVDRSAGGFVERLTLAGTDEGMTFKRTRVTARQVYVFSQAALFGFPGAAEVAEHGWRFLEAAWLPDRLLWARTLTRSGRVLDPTPDLYDIAFCLFATSWYHRLTGDREALRRAEAALSAIDTTMRWPDGGFVSEVGPGAARQQNPHMHLLEALLSLVQVTGGGRAESMAREIVHLFQSRLWDQQSGAVRENFDVGWVPGAGPAAYVEPGHNFEWAWLLASDQKITGRSQHAEIAALVDFGERYGVSASGAVVNRVTEEGGLLDPASRVWPNAERIKGALGRFAVLGCDPRMAVAQSSCLLLNRYLGGGASALWTEELDGDGRPLAAFVPASTLYHLFLAFTEVANFEVELQALSR